MDIAWVTGALGVAGVVGTYATGWMTNRKTEQKFATRDALNTLNDLLVAANSNILILTADLKIIKEERDKLKKEMGELKQENYELRHRIYELENPGSPMRGQTI